MKTVISMICVFLATSLARAGANECQFGGETPSTSMEQHYGLIKQVLSGPDLSKYFLACGSFLGNERYYSDLESPEAKAILGEIRGIDGFKKLTWTILLNSTSDQDINLELIDVAGNWKNDDQFAAVLIRLLSSKNRDVRLEAAGALKGTSSPVAISKLLEMIKNSAAPVRYIGAVALEGTKVPAARAALIELRNDPDPGIRAQAIVGTL